MSASIKGCFRDSQGNAVMRAGTVGLRGQGWMATGTGINPGDGNFTIARVPANMPLELYSTLSPAAFAPVAISSLTAGEVRQLPCTVVTNLPTTTSTVIPLPTTLFTPPVVNPPPNGNVAAFAGNYTGTFAGSETGTFSVTVTSTGAITGQTNSTTTGTALVSGTVVASGAVLLTATQGTSGAASFTGTFSTTGVVSGTWRYTNGFPGSGTFIGQRTISRNCCRSRACQAGQVHKKSLSTTS